MWFKVLSCAYVQSASLSVLAICPRKQCEPSIPYLVLPCSSLSYICSVPWPVNPSAKSEGPVCVDMSPDACRPYPQATPAMRPVQTRTSSNFYPFDMLNSHPWLFTQLGCWFFTERRMCCHLWTYHHWKLYPFFTPNTWKAKTSHPALGLSCPVLSNHPAPCSVTRPFHPQMKNQSRDVCSQNLSPLLPTEPLPTLEPQNCWLTPLLLGGGGWSLDHISAPSGETTLFSTPRTPGWRL